jgi:hypothetical protein
MKNTEYERKANRKRNYTELSILINTPNILHKVLSFPISDIHSSITTEKQMHIHTIFLIGNDSRNKVLKY